MALATGADTKKMKYGHRGGNHPVKDLDTGRVYISSQNHGYMVDADSVDESVADVAFVNVNDNTVEGLRYKEKSIWFIQQCIYWIAADIFIYSNYHGCNFFL